MATQSKQGSRVPKSTRILKPSPNEEEAILKGAFAERRKQRLLQVRKQQKRLSGKILNAVKSKRDTEVNYLKIQLQNEWEKKISAELEELEEEYKNRMHTLGDGHSAVSQIPITDLSESEEIMNQRALERHREALRKLAEHRVSLKSVEEAKSRLRQKVAKEEQVRASSMAAKPPPAPDYLLKPENTSRGSTLSSRMKTTESFSSTRFHMPIAYVEKADQGTKVDAREAAKSHEDKVLQARELLDKDLNERKEKANLRHQHARQQVLLDQSKDRLIEQLENLEYKDRVRRQQALAKIPKQVFQPPYQRLEDAKSRQIMLEEAFENAHIPKRDAHIEELNLDIESNLDITAKDHTKQNEVSFEDANVKNDESVQSSSEMQAKIPAQKEDAITNADAQKQLQPDNIPLKKTASDTSSRMQKLLGRIRKQQDDWSKQTANRRTIIQVENKEDDQERDGENESADSLVSADIDSARYTNSNTESTSDDQDKHRVSGAEPEPSPPNTPEQESLLHPFEKAKLVRTSSSKADSGTGGEYSVDQDSLPDMNKRKRTLENQKHLLKIQRQRLENQLLRQDLQATEKKLEGLMNKDAERVDTETEKMQLVNDGLLSSGNTENHEQEFLPRIETDGYNSLANQTAFSVMSGLTASQRRDLASRYPHIFKGFSVDNFASSESIVGIKSKENWTTEPEGVAGSSPVTSAQETTADSPPILRHVAGSETYEKTKLSKPRVEIDRIRKYQEQLLQKQRWLKSRQEIIQKRHEGKIKELCLGVGELGDKQGLDGSDTHPVDGPEHSDFVDEGRFVSNPASPSQPRKFLTLSPSKTLLDRIEPVTASKQIENETSLPTARVDQVFPMHSYQRPRIYEENEDTLALEVKDSALAAQNLAHLLSRSSTFNQRQSVYERLRTMTSENDERRKGVRQTNSITELLPEMRFSERHDGSDEEIFETYEGNGTERLRALLSSESPFSGPRLLTEARTSEKNSRGRSSEVNSSHANDVEITHQSISQDVLTMDNLPRKGHRLVSGKPAFSPIQEVEETSFKAKSGAKSGANAAEQGIGSVSSLVEQALPLSGRSSSDRSSVSLRASTAPTEKSDASSAFSFRELISSLSETEFHPLPAAANSIMATLPTTQLLPANGKKTGNSPEVVSLPPSHSVDNDNWMRLLPDYSELEGRTRQPQKDYVSNLHPKTSLKVFGDDIFSFDREKYQRIVQENLTFDKISLDLIPKNRERVHAYEYQQGSDSVTPVEPQLKVAESAVLRLPDLPFVDSQQLKTHDSVPSLLETKAVLIEDSSSSSEESKVSSTNMSRYEEILSRVRMLPYKHLEEYNRLAESYQSWRKRTVEPLLHPDVPDPFVGYDVFTNRDPTELTTKKADHIDHIATSGQAPQPSFIEREKLSLTENAKNHSPLANHATARKRIELFGPVRDFVPLGRRNDAQIIPADVEGTRIRSSWNKNEIVTTVPYTWDSDATGAQRSRDASLEESHLHESVLSKYENDAMEIPGAFLADQLMEQKLFESINSFYNQAASKGVKGDVERRGERMIDVSEAGKHDVTGESDVYNSVEDTDMGYDNKVRKSDAFDLEEFQRQFLDKYVSTFGAISATKSLFTNSSSQNTKSQFSSDFRSDETVSELARLWPLSLKSIGADKEESLMSAITTIPGLPKDRSSFGNHSDVSGLRKAESSDGMPSGFKDPNNYEISLYRTNGGDKDQIVQSTDSSKTDRSKTDSSETDSSKTDSSKTDSSKTDSSETDSSKTDSSKTDSSKTDSSETDSSKTDSSKTDSIKTDSSETDSIKTDSSNTDSSKTDSNKTDSSKADSSETDSRKFLKDESDGGFSLPSFPRFASTRLATSDRPSSASGSESSFGMNAYEGLNTSLMSEVYDENDGRHSETSWLLPSDSLRNDVFHQTSILSDGVQKSAATDDSSNSSIKQYETSVSDNSPKTSSCYDASESDVVGTWNDHLAQQAITSSSKSSDPDLPEAVRLKKDAFIRNSQQRLMKVNERAAKNESKAVKFRADGRIEKTAKTINKENKDPSKPRKVAKKPAAVTGNQSGEAKLQQTIRRDGSKKPSKQEILQENRRRVKQFQKKIQSSLRSRRK